MNDTIHIAMIRAHINMTQLTNKFRTCSKNTLYKKVNDPQGEMTLGEFRRLSQILNLTAEEREEILKCGK